MDRIKFRAWDDKNKKWLLGYDYENLGGFSLTGETILMGEWGNVFWSFISDDDKDFDDLKIMQFIGITIKGREIYKNDVYRHVDGAHFQVVWNDDRSGWDYLRLEDGAHMYEYYDWGLLEESEYIGSIYENPELIGLEEI